MRPRQSTVGRSGACFPRVSGDAPTRLGLTGDTLQFSPRERGCARVSPSINTHPVVFPA